MRDETHEVNGEVASAESGAWKTYDSLYSLQPAVRCVVYGQCRYLCSVLKRSEVPFVTRFVFARSNSNLALGPCRGSSRIRCGVETTCA